MASRIEDYAIVGDMQSAALVSTDGSVDWLCLPRFDSEACFAALLGRADHGCWRIAPEDELAGRGGATVRRRYAGDTLILQTRWETAGGIAEVTDFMPPREDGEPPVLIRLVQGVSGTVDMGVRLTLRFGYGSIVPWVTKTEGGIRATAGPDSVLAAHAGEPDAPGPGAYGGVRRLRGRDRSLRAHLPPLTSGSARTP